MQVKWKNPAQFIKWRRGKHKNDNWSEQGRKSIVNIMLHHARLWSTLRKLYIEYNDQRQQPNSPYTGRHKHSDG